MVLLSLQRRGILALSIQAIDSLFVKFFKIKTSYDETCTHLAFRLKLTSYSVKKVKKAF